MTYLEHLYLAFNDELQKIAGELQGHVRSGRRPISVDRLLARENETNVLESPLEEPVDGAEKEAAAEAAAAEGAKGLLKHLKLRDALMLGGGGAVAVTGNQALQDFQNGRQMRRMQQQGY